MSLHKADTSLILVVIQLNMVNPNTINPKTRMIWYFFSLSLRCHIYHSVFIQNYHLMCMCCRFDIVAPLISVTFNQFKNWCWIICPSTFSVPFRYHEQQQKGNMRSRKESFVIHSHSILHVTHSSPFDAITCLHNQLSMSLLFHWYL